LDFSRFYVFKNLKPKNLFFAIPANLRFLRLAKMDLPFTLPVAEGTGLQAYRPADIVFADIDMRQIGMSVLCGILLKIIYADRTNAKDAAEIWYKIA